jgi:folate-binding protein YgfZ
MIHMPIELAPNRTIIEITGADSEKFLSDLITNDLSGANDGLIYAALLSPKGKYLFDFFITNRDDTFLLDIATDRAPHLAQRLNMYKLRADVTLTGSDMSVGRGLGNAPAGAMADPRHAALGWRLYGAGETTAPTIDWDAIRVANCIPETGIELIPDDTYILEAGFEHLNGVDFRKGCYVGQEITARMKHKTELRKGFVTVEINGTAPNGTDIMVNGKVAGQLYTQAGENAIAYLRFDRAGDNMTAGDAKIKYCAPI